MAYNFKRQAIATDTNLRQFVIENGFNLNDPYENDDGGSNNNKHNCAAVEYQQQRHRQDSLMATPTNHLPFIMKSEPVDYEIMSDITIETNTETAYDSGLNTSASCASLNHQPLHTNQQQSQSTLFVLPQSSMVQLNNNLLGRTNIGNSSDREFISNYLPAASITDDEQQLSLPQQRSGSYVDLLDAKNGYSNSPALIVANVKSKCIDLSESPKTDEDDETPPPVNVLPKPQPIKVKRKRNRELHSIASYWGSSGSASGSASGSGIILSSSANRKDVDGYALRRHRDMNKIPKNTKNGIVKQGNDEVINPAANRLRQRIKTELLSQSLPADILLNSSNPNRRLKDNIDVTKKSSPAIIRQPQKKSKIASTDHDAAAAVGKDRNNKLIREKTNKIKLQQKQPSAPANISKFEFKAFKRNT